MIPSEEPLVSHREDHYYITVNTNVTKTDVYRCVVTQDDIRHQTQAETFVYISEISLLVVLTLNQFSCSGVGCCFVVCVLYLICSYMLSYISFVVFQCLRTRPAKWPQDGCLVHWFWELSLFLHFKLCLEF